MKETENISNRLVRRIQVYVWIVVGGLFFSGITAFPIETELKWLAEVSGERGLFHAWFRLVYNAVHQANLHYPYLSYGTDWLAFAHLMLAVLFCGALNDPLRNKWVIEFGIIASVCIFPLAFIAGAIRQVPLFWRLIDCSFGVVTLMMLLPCYRMIGKLSRMKNVC
jgi:hypothetical protein